MIRLLVHGIGGLLLWAWALSATADPKPGGTMTIIVQPEPPMLNLTLNQQAPTQIVAGKILQSLLVFSHSLVPLPSLAESWKVSADGKVYTFKLQRNVKWHDGKPFTAHDVVFTISKVLMETHPRARQIFSRCEEITAPDDHTVVFRLKEPFAPFLMAFEVTTTPIIPRHLYEGTDFRSNPYNVAPVGTGPFRFVRWDRGEQIVLKRFDDYWKPGKPYLDGIVFRVMGDSSHRREAIERGLVDQSQFSDINFADVDSLVAAGKVQMTKRGYEMYSPIAWVELNHRVAPLGDRRFRQALYYALDREVMRQTIWRGFARIATGPVNSATRFYEPNLKRYAHDVAKARALLDEMGLKPGPDGVRVRLKLLKLPYGEVWDRLADFLQRSWREIGVAVELEAVWPGAWLQRVSNWEYEMTISFLYQFGDPALGVSRSYVSTNIKKGLQFGNSMGYVNPRVDELFELGARSIEPARRQQIYSEVQRLLVEDVPVLWLLEMEFPTLINKRFVNPIATAIGVNESYDDVYLRE